MSPMPEVEATTTHVVYDLGSLRTRVRERRDELVRCSVGFVVVLVLGSLAVSYSPWFWVGCAAMLVCAAVAEVVNPLTIFVPPVRRITLSAVGIEASCSGRSVQRGWQSMTELRIREMWGHSCSLEVRTGHLLQQLDLVLVGSPAQVVQAVERVRAAATANGVPVVTK